VFNALTSTPTVSAQTSGTVSGQATFTGQGVTHGPMLSAGRTSSPTVTIGTFSGSIRAGKPRAFPISYTPSGRGVIKQLNGPGTLRVTVVFAPAVGKAASISLSAQVKPTPIISSVSFTGDPAKPTIVVHGTKLGALPKPSPSSHPSGQKGCPTLAGDTGYDYGTNLYIVVPAKNWSGGRYQPTITETDCIDLIVTKFTQTEVDFHFGPFYTSSYPKFSLAPGSQVEVGVNGVTSAATVKYG
jgi:hypothetical protein